ncbi:MAG: hypothetical protein E3J21_15510, partial [Anaerolineales bacterium]
MVIYKNRDIDFRGPDPTGLRPNPINWDYYVGINRPVETAAQAENEGVGAFVDIPLAQGDYVVIVADDCQGCYHDNQGGITLSVSVIAQLPPEPMSDEERALWATEGEIPELAPPTPTLRPTPTPTATIDADTTVYDNFNNPAFDGGINTGLWEAQPSPPGRIGQQNGVMVLTHWPSLGDEAAHIIPIRSRSLKLDQLEFVEAKLLLSSEAVEGEYGDVALGLEPDLSDGRYLRIECSVHRASINCAIFTSDGSRDLMDDPRCDALKKGGAPVFQ